MVLARYNNLFGCIPIGVGCKVVDIQKGKIGECKAVGFVSGTEGERVTMDVKGRKGSTRNHFAMFNDVRVVPHVGHFARHLAEKYWVQVTNVLDGRAGAVFIHIAKCYVVSSAKQQRTKKREAAKEAKEKAVKKAKEKAEAEAAKKAKEKVEAETAKKAKQKAKQKAQKKVQKKTSKKKGKTGKTNKKPKEKAEAEAAQKAKEKAEAEAAKKAKEKAEAEAAKKAKEKVEAEAAKKAKQKAQKKVEKKTKKKAEKGSDSSSEESSEAASPDITLIEPRVVIRDLTLVRKFVSHFVDHLPDISHRPDIDPKSVQLWMKDDPNTITRRRKSVKHPKRRYAATHSLLFGMCGKDTNKAIDFAIECNYWCVTFEDEDGDLIDLVDDCIVCVWLHYMANNLVGCV